MSESHKGLLKGIPKSEEHKHKLSQARIGKEPWNKGKSYGKTPWIDAGVSRTTWYRHAMHKDAFSRKG